METSQLIAKFMGPVMLVAGFSMLINKAAMRAVFKDFIASPALIFVAGFLALMLGLALVIFHNRWTAGWPVIITVYGWLSLFAGVGRMAFPALVKRMGTAMMKREAFLTVAAIFNLLLGGFLTYQGYLA